MTAEEFNAQMFSEELRTKIPMKGSGISTLLIPSFFIRHLELRSKRFNGMPAYFSHLLRRFRIILRSFARNPEGLKTLYQKKNQDLRKVNFRPFNEDWAEIGTFSVASGRSRCLLFVILLIFDMAKFGAAFRKAGILMNDPFTKKRKWELISLFGVDRNEGFCIRGFTPIEIRLYSDGKNT
ncbi:MAG TPA: DUF1564 family protein [Leptospiraceae bacterium]|nr:DUF1564 family protein [Leptospiraceae bacterium]